VAFAGPNAGGVLVIHNTGVLFSSDTVVPPVTPQPASCSEMNNTGLLGSAPFIWKIYAVFPQAATPRLASTAYGIAETLPAGSGITLSAWGLANTGDFEVNDGVLWPHGGGLGEAFTAGLRTATINDLYFFAGYAYGNAGGEPSVCTEKWIAQPAIWVSDGVPALEDQIAGFGCMGFGIPGYTPCPAEPGACCTYAGVCTIVLQADCHDIWNGAPVCLPTTCAVPGKCCDPVTAVCTFVHQDECTGVFTAGEDCSVACPLPTGACCAADYTCTVTLQADCVGNWVIFGTCAPGDCPTEPMGACCQLDGTCAVTGVLHCVGSSFILGGACQPTNPCPQPTGSCCDPYDCIVVTLADCQGPGWTWHMFDVCPPATPCPPPPAQAACCHAGWIQGMQGYCTVEFEAPCLAGNPGNVWHPEWLTCTPLPTPCPVIPTVESNWGAIKNIYR